LPQHAHQPERDRVSILIIVWVFAPARMKAKHRFHRARKALDVLHNTPIVEISSLCLYYHNGPAAISLLVGDKGGAERQVAADVR
jgi:hypothetical protein